MTKSNPSSDFEEIEIVRNGLVAGRISRDGKSVRVESLEDDGSYRLLGFYERTDRSTFPRKANEIDEIFDAWRSARFDEGSHVKVSWRRREFVPGFRELSGALTVGCSVVEDNGIPIAYVYKIKPTSAKWVDA